MTDTRLYWQKWMAAKGISVFELEKNSKRPIEGYSWYTRQTTDANQIEEWAKENPDRNYGVHLGKDYAVIDIDRFHQFQEICTENEIDDFLLEINTFTVKTPSGGYHLYFKVPFPCANRNSFPDGIDVRGVHGYVVGPGSKDSRGTWEVVDPDAPIMDIPDWLLDYVEKPGHRDPKSDDPVTELDQPENVTQAMEWLKNREPAIEGRNGDDWTYETCNWLRDFGLSPEKILEILNDSGWNARCEPPWGDNELEIKIRNSWEYGQNRPGIKSKTFKVKKFIDGFESVGMGNLLTKEQIAQLFHPEFRPKLVVDNTKKDDPEIPVDVVDDEIDPETGEVATSDSFWCDINEFVKMDKVRQYIVSDWLIAHGLTHLIAKRGTGKSTIALDLAFHISCDRDWWGIPIQKGWKVVYLCGEDLEGFNLNAKAWIKHHKISPDDDRFLLGQGILSLTKESILNVRIQQIVEWAAGCPCLVIIDTWQRATMGWGKNDQEAMEQAVKNAERVARTIGGPCFICAHPPKDGRMTITGSGVQEDTSTGIWHLQEIAQGIKLSIDRAKGPGRHNYRLFQMQKVTLEGEDYFGRPLEGIVMVKIGGHESENSIENVNSLDRELRAWADAIDGCDRFPTLDNKFEPLSELNIEKVAKFIDQIYNLSKDMNEQYENIMAAQECYHRFFIDIEPYVSGISEDRIKKRLKELFLANKVPPTVMMNDGLRTMVYVPKYNSGKRKITNPRKVFKFRERKKSD